MEETLTDCLVRVREDLRQLKRVRDYLDTNAETEERCSVTWRTIEAFNSILSVCSSQNTPETNALDTLLDSFYYLARNNKDDSVWIDFGFELGMICVKVLSAIERTEVFEILFCKLLSVISIISEHNSNIWKAAARQILNVLINKKVSLSYLEAILKVYISILKNIENSALYDFSSQNLHLLKTLSLLVQKTGDFEIQSDVMELIFFHLSKETKLMSGFFSSLEGTFLQSLEFTDFEKDCRLYLNAVNRPRRAFERKVYSICCHVLYLGGCFVEPPIGRNHIWVDANKDSERVSIKCADIESNANRVIYILFSEILNVQLENDKTEGNRCLTIQTKTLLGVQKDVKNDDVCLVVENKGEVIDFINFLQTTIAGRKKMKKLGGKGSKTIDCLLINRNNQRQEVQDNAITSSERPGIDNILPDVLSLFERTDQVNTQTKPQKIPDGVSKTPSKTTRIVLESQELSPNSFVESLNKHIGTGSPEPRHTFEDSIETIEFLQKNTSKAHKLFRSPDKFFPDSNKNETNFNFIFGENKENNPLVEVKSEIKTYSRKSRDVKSVEKPSTSTFVLKDQRNIETKLTNTESQDYFHRASNVLKKKKPCLPKLKRNAKPSKTAKQLKPRLDNKNTSNENISLQAKERKQGENHNKLRTFQRLEHEPNKLEKQHVIKSTALVQQVETKERQKWKENLRVCTVGKTSNRKPDSPHQKKQNKPESEQKKNRAAKQEEKPSLLDPNGYAYQRWCRPTTSERSNFWLKKLNASQKLKIDSDSIFDFSDDSVIGGTKRKKKVVCSNPKLRSRTKLTTLRQVKEIFKKSPMKAKLRDSPREKQPNAPKELSLPPRNEPTAKSPDSPPEVMFNPAKTECKCSSESSNEVLEDKDSEYESVSEGEEPPVVTKKRERSDEDTSTSRRRGKKKQKTTFPKNLLLNLQQRLRNAEEDKRRTDDIIQTVNKATDHLFDNLQRKSVQTFISYLKTAEEASAVFLTEKDDLSMRGKRIQRAVLYFKVGCSISDAQETLDDQFSKIRSKLKDLREKRDPSEKVDRISEKLTNVIKSEIERLLKDEWESKRNRLVSCASIWGSIQKT